jgi:hypothetical protein
MVLQLPKDIPRWIVNSPSVFILVRPTSEALAGITHFTSGTRKALAASGEMTKDKLPKSNMQHNGNYFPS